MINQGYNPLLKITDAPKLPNENGYSTIKHIKNARLGVGSDVINSHITHLMGSPSQYGSNNFATLFALDGKGRKKAIRSLDGTFTEKVLGRPKVTDIISANFLNLGNSATDRIGENGSKFKIAFKNKFFMRNEYISTGGLDGISIHIQSDGEKQQGLGWVYTAKVAGKRKFIPSKYLVPGTVWAAGVVVVGLLDSRGTTHRRAQAPFDMINQLSVIRRSYNYAGNVSSKKLNVPFQVDNKTINFWVDWEYYHNEMLFKQAINEFILFSEYNRLPDNTINNQDADTEEAAPITSGIWEQIFNKISFTKLTKAKIDEAAQVALDTNNIIGNNNDGDILMVGGMGFLEEANEALGGILNNLLMTTDTFVRGKDPMNLEVGTFFTQYRHPSGKLIKFVHEPAFDIGARALTAPRDPKNSSRSIMTYSGMLLNCNKVEVSAGSRSLKSSLENNITLVYEEGREMEEWLVLGGSRVPDVDMDKYFSRATDVDASAHHKMMTIGVHVHQPQSCVKLVKKLA